MLGKANSEVTPTFAVSLQKPKGSITVAFCSSYLTLHTQGCGKERLVRFHAMRSTHASRVKHFKKSCYPNSRLIDQLKSCHPGASIWSSVLVGATLWNTVREPKFLSLALILYYTWGTTLPGLEQRKPVEAGITASIWYATLHYHKFYKSLFPKWFQDAV